LADLFGYVGDVNHLSGALLWPVFDLFLRLWLAQIFWLSGIQKLTNWESALHLAAHEYPVSWLDPATSAYLGAAIEFLCPIFFALGLATRAAALPMLILSLVIHFEYQQLNSQVYWAVLLGWYVVMGAGALSLDRLLGRGLADSALPLAGSISGFLERIFTRPAVVCAGLDPSAHPRDVRPCGEGDGVVAGCCHYSCRLLRVECRYAGFARLPARPDFGLANRWWSVDHAYDAGNRSSNSAGGR
jgi:uncharacterized membrane protein YphA (DoxX/SURF4 family)